MGVTVAVVIRATEDHARLDRAIRSVRDQTYQDVAVVLAVADDADASAAEGLVAEDPRVTLVRGTGRGGLANAALAAVDADLIVLHDDDGSWDPAFLALTVAFLDTHPDHVAVATRAELVHAGAAGSREVLAGHEPAVSLTSLLVHNYVPPASLLFRRLAAEAIGRYDEELPALEDWEFLLRLVAYGPVGFLPDTPLAAWYADPPGDPATRRAAELLVRDRVLRRDLTGKEPGIGGLGLLLAVSDQVSAIADRWGQAHQDHLDAVRGQQRIELGRIRGEMLLVRELVSELQDDIAVLGTQVEESVARTNRTFELIRGRRAQPPSSGLARRVVRRLTARNRSL